MIWTPQQDAVLGTLTDLGAAAVLGVSQDAARNRRKRLGLQTPVAQNVRAPRVSHPQGFEPGVKWDGKRGTITSRPQDGQPDWNDILKTFKFDPEVYEVIEPVQVRSWDVLSEGLTKTMWYYRANLRQKRAATDADMAAIIAEIKAHRVRPIPVPPKTERAFVAVLSDWQLGKERTEEAVDRVLRGLDGIYTRIIDLDRIDRPVDAVYLLGLGDIIENCDGQYAMQAYQTELNRREQVTLARRLITKYVTTLAAEHRVVVAAVPGNHGENRKDGKAFTDFGDNDDVAVFEQVADVIAANPAYGHVSFVLPKNDLTLTLDIAGTIVGLAHGHQARRAGSAQQKMQAWWAGQAFGQLPIGDAQILVSGHFHHLSIIEDGPRTHMQAPTMDSGSQWFSETAGKPSRPGLLTFTVDSNGWDDVMVLR